MSQNLGADELRVRAHLRELVDGPATEPAAMPPKPARLPSGYQPRERDWLDDILDNNTPAPAPVPSGPQPLPGPVSKTKPPEPAPKLRARRPARTREQHDSPRESLVDATARIPRRIRWLIYHATAAAAGWWLGWVGWATSMAAWYADGHWTSPDAWVLYGLGLGSLALYRRARAWAWPLAWGAAVPVSSVVLGVLLYGTGYPS